jgi:DNA-binding transcriptional LysR family regulator
MARIPDLDILEAVEAADNLTVAAQQLGMSRQNLHSRLSKLPGNLGASCPVYNKDGLTDFGQDLLLLIGGYA